MGYQERHQQQRSQPTSCSAILAISTAKIRETGLSLVWPSQTVGIPDRQPQLIEPDYENKTIGQVYAAATFVVFLHDRKSDYLQAATPWQALRSSPNAEEGMCPSWAFEFEKVNIEGDHSPRSMDFQHYVIHGVCAGSQIKEMSINCQLKNPHVLMVKGIVCSKVIQKTPNRTSTQGWRLYFSGARAGVFLLEASSAVPPGSHFEPK